MDHLSMFKAMDTTIIKPLEIEACLLDRLTAKTNRSKAQTNFLFNVLSGRLQLLLDLEEKIKNNNLFYCPADYLECAVIFDMQNAGSFSLDEFYTVTDKEALEK